MDADSEVYEARLIRAVKQRDTEAVIALARARGREDGRLDEAHVNYVQSRYNIEVGIGLPTAFLAVRQDYAGGARNFWIPLCPIAYAHANGILDLGSAIELDDVELFEERLHLDDVNGIIGVIDTPLTLALKKGQTYMIRRLLESGARVEALPFRGGRSFTRSPMITCRSKELARMMCAYSSRLAHRCAVLPGFLDLVKFADVFYQAGAPPCDELKCPLRAFQGQVLTLQRQCSNRIRRNKLDRDALPEAMAEAVASFAL